MRPKSVCVIAVALAMLAPATLASAAPTDPQGTQLRGLLDQHQEVVEPATAASPLSSYLAQTFTAGISGSLDKVELSLCLDLPPYYTDTAFVRIESVANGIPSGSVLATATPVTLDSAQCQWIPFAFAAPAHVVAGTRYAIVMLAPTPYWGISPERFGDLYPAGQAISNGFVYAEPSDFAFRTYVKPMAAPEVRVTTNPELPATLTPASPIEAKVKLGDKFVSLDRLCVTLRFQGDLLDPGDVVALEFIGGIGVNPGAPSQDQRTLCSTDPVALAVWLDGKQDLAIFADLGTSVTIAAIEFEAVGTPKAEPTPSPTPTPAPTPSPLPTPTPTPVPLP